MDPISLAIGAVGLGISLFGASKQAGDSRQSAEISNHISQVSQDEASHEQRINDLKQQQMELEGRRTQMENIRNNQRARALATNAAVNQGAQLGSGLQGGLSQIAAQSAFNMSGVNSALEVGRGINSQNNYITQDKITTAGLQGQQAQVQGQTASDQALTSLGGAVMKAGPLIGGLSQGFGKMNIGNLFMGGGSPSGYGSR